MNSFQFCLTNRLSDAICVCPLWIKLLLSVVTAVDLSFRQLFIKAVSRPDRKLSYSDSIGSQTFSHAMNQLFSYSYSLSVNLNLALLSMS